MLDSISDLAVGATGTATYLLLWNWVLRVSKPAENASADQISRARLRTRIWQVIFFLLMTPYVLFLFFIMETVR